MKKIALLLAVLLLMGIFAGCGKDRLADGENTEPTESVTVAGEFDHMHADGEHIYVAEEIEVADCTHDGRILHICVICGEGFEEIVSSYGHEMDVASCLEGAYCANCGELLESPLGHLWDNGVCSRCGATK